MRWPTKVSIWPRIAMVALAQAAVLGWIVWDRITLLETGREVVLAVEPVDPRSLFRGDYVILSYQISQLPKELLTPSPPFGTPVHVTLERGAGETWSAVATSLAPPTAPPQNGRVVIRGTSLFTGPRNANEPARTPLKFGIESYFVPEGQGLEIEKLVGEKRVEALIAVGPDGRAAIKGLLADGGLIHRERAY